MPYSADLYTRTLVDIEAFPGLLELFSIVVRAKPNALLFLAERNIHALESFCSLYGLSYTVSDRLWKPLDTEAEYINACIEVRENDRQPEQNVFRYIFVSLNNHDLDTYRRLENEPIIDHGELGKLLHYPHCCIDFFVRNWDLAIELHGGDLTPLLVERTPVNCQCPKWANHFLDYLGFPIISHFPCSLSCSATVRQTKLTVSTLNKDIPDLGSRLASMLSWPVLFSPGNGLAFITRWEQQKLTEVSCLSAVFPHNSKWEPILSDFNIITCVSSGGLDLQDAKGNSVKVIDGRLLSWDSPGVS